MVVEQLLRGASVESPRMLVIEGLIAGDLTDSYLGALAVLSILLLNVCDAVPFPSSCSPLRCSGHRAADTGQRRTLQRPAL